MKIALASDHAGFQLKEVIKKFLIELGHDVKDFGAIEYNDGDDYPDFIIPAAKAVAAGEVDRAIVFGSSGQGEGIASNRVNGVRAFVYYGDAKPLSKHTKVGKIENIVQVSREDNDSNVLSLGASFVSEDEAKKVIKLWLDTLFTNEERHARRIKKLDNF